MGNPIVTQINKVPIVKHGEVYKHFTGGLYKVTSVASDFITGVTMIVLQELQGAYEEYVVPICLFSERVNKDIYVNSTQEFKFEKVQLMNFDKPTYDDKNIIMRMISEEHPVYIGPITRELDKFLVPAFLTRVQTKTMLPTIIPNRRPNDRKLLLLKFGGMNVGEIKVNSDLLIEDVVMFPKYYCGQQKVYTHMVATCLDKFIGYTFKFIN